MDSKSIGDRIAGLRKKNNMTQASLAKKLNISDKTVSKWENGQGFPDITAFPLLSSLFGVSVDYLMFGAKKGIAIAGNLIADIVKNIDVYPAPGMMAYVSDVTPAVGGCVPNTAINLSKIDRSIPISTFGKVGNDENGRYIVSQLLKNGIDTDGISFSPTAATSFCDVMSMPGGERTFFHKKGANAEFAPENVRINYSDFNMLHIGYILLLDEFDKGDAEYGTVMARFLHDVQKHGVKTSIDIVSDSDADYAEKIIPALKYCNFAIINELECCRIFGIDAYDSDGNLDKESVKTAMRKAVDCGVSDKVIVHSKKVSFILNAASGEICDVPSLDIPKDLIKGSVGAGDAFCAGCIYGIYNNLSDRQILEFASSAAACSLFEANSVDGMKSKGEIMSLSEKYGRVKI